MSRLRTRLATRPLDGLAGLVAVVGSLECWLAAGVPAPALTTAAIGLFALAVAVRRRWPAGALIFAASVTAVQFPLGGGLGETPGVGTMLTLVVLTYTAGAWLEPPRAALALAAGLTIFSVFMIAIAPDMGTAIGNEAFAVPLVFAAPWCVGRWLRKRGDRAAAFAELATEAAAAHTQQERQAIESERERIRHELHDIIAHSVSAMVIGAGGARRLLGSDHERARDSILALEQTGREALADLRRMLGMLRRDGDPRLLAPQPGMDQLPALLGSLRGLRCELHSEGEPLALTPGVNLVSYRAIEAVLECAVRNGSSRATVTVRGLPDVLELEVDADGPTIDVARQLRGIAERVALYDGSLTAELDCVQVRVPLSAQVLG